jgi:tRNA-binding EMAP/Myf-like protein
MQNRRVVCVANLKPAAMRGIVSQAMVLAATHPETGKVRGTHCSLPQPLQHRLSPPFGLCIAFPFYIGWGVLLVDMSATTTVP